MDENYPYLTYAQKRVLRELKANNIKYQVTYTHSDGSISILAEGRKFRIDEKGDTWDEGISSVKTPPKPIESKPSVKPPAKQTKPRFAADLWGEHTELPPSHIYHVEPVSTKRYEYAPEKTVCQGRRDCCKARDFQHVAFDADHTIWTTGNVIASGITGKLCRIDDNTMLEIDKDQACPSGTGQQSLEEIAEDIKNGLSASQKGLFADISPGGKTEAVHVRTTIKLFPTFRKTLDELEKRGITRSIISLNTPGSVSRILKEFGLADKFVDIRDSWDNKGKVFEEQMKKLGKCPCDGLFVDDRRDHIEEVTKRGGIGIQIGEGKDIVEPIEILKFIKER